MHPSLPSRLDACIRAAWQNQLAQARRTAGLLPTLVQHRQELLPCFANYYQHLRNLPRRVQRRLQRQFRSSLAGLALALTLGSVPAQAATIAVAVNETAIVDNGVCSLIEAIVNANDGAQTYDDCVGGDAGADTIVLQNGSVHTLTTVNNGADGDNGLPLITTEIIIQGNGSTITRDSMAAPFRIFAINPSGNLTVRQTTISGGLVSGGFPGDRGGGVANFAGRVTLINSTVSGNTANQDGGGVYSSGTLTLTDSTVSGNSAGNSGGGVDNRSGTATLTNSTVSGNFASDAVGGGVHNNAGSLTLLNSTISGNTIAGRIALAGGLANTSKVGTATLINSTVTGNMAASDSLTNVNSGIFVTAPTTLIRSIVSGNTSPNSSGVGVEVLAINTTITSDYSLFGHSGETAAQAITGLVPSATDIVATSTSVGGATHIPTPLASILDPILDNNGGPTQTHALVAGSPAVDAAGLACPPPGVDQRGFLRPADGNGDSVAVCDIGAFELNVRSPLNHFLCYKTKASTGNTCAAGSVNAGLSCETDEQCGPNPETDLCVPNKFPKGLTVALTDQFDPNVTFVVQKPTSLCNPANKNDEDPTAVTDPDHLQAFQIKEAKGQPKPERQTNLLITNQFGDLRVDTLKPSRLLVPTAKDEENPVPEPTPTIDHFKCYTVKGTPQTPKFEKRTVTVVDQFNQPKLFDVVKPTRLCTPADKAGETPGAETHPEHLLCYQVKPARTEPRHVKVLNIHVNNQFGPERLDTLKEEELCVPSSKTVP